jgi:ABC-type uncharacterized transport system substrate-binding protein
LALDSLRGGTKLGNLTGMATMSWRHCRPRLVLLREIIPKAQCVALIYHSANAALELQVRESRAAARDLGLELPKRLSARSKSPNTKGAEALLATSDRLVFLRAIGPLKQRKPVSSDATRDS